MKSESFMVPDFSYKSVPFCLNRLRDNRAPIAKPQMEIAPFPLFKIYSATPNTSHRHIPAELPGRLHEILLL